MEFHIETVLSDMGEGPDYKKTNQTNTIPILELKNLSIFSELHEIPRFQSSYIEKRLGQENKLTWINAGKKHKNNGCVSLSSALYFAAMQTSLLCVSSLASWCMGQYKSKLMFKACVFYKLCMLCILKLRKTINYLKKMGTIYTKNSDRFFQSKKTYNIGVVFQHCLGLDMM